MELTKKQQEALELAIARYKAHEKYVCISGYAGTGKSTTIKFIIEALPGVDPQADVKYVAYTGKAANVLKNKGCPGAMTAHKLLYQARMMPDGKYHFFPRSELEDNPLVIVVDEISMLPKKMWDLLCRHNVFIIAAGDPAQLPPVQDNPNEDTNNHVLDNPHVFLNEIMRQAAESEIIRFSMHIREGKPLASYKADNKEVMLIPKQELTNGMLLWADQVLCATNRTCGQNNDRMRQALGFQGGPQIGDKIINRHNEWEFLSSSGNPLTNGVIGNIQNYIQERDFEYPGWIRKARQPHFKVPIIQCDMSGDEEGEIFSNIFFDKGFLMGEPENLNGKEKYLIQKQKLPIPFTFTYGYCITTWKAQGSQWDKILVFSEHWPTDPDLYQRYLYTSATRAAEKLVVIY